MDDLLDRLDRPVPVMSKRISASSLMREPTDSSLSRGEPVEQKHTS